MELLLVALLLAADPVQTGQDARPLLREVAAASQNLKSFRARGDLTYEGSFPLHGHRVTESFEVALQQPQRMRLDVSSSEKWMNGLPFRAVCDGDKGLVYYEQGNHYQKIARGDMMWGYCDHGTITGFEDVADNVQSAVVKGRDHVQFEGAQRECVVVEAKYRVISHLMISAGMVATLARVSRTMCIDPERRLILRDHLEADFSANPGSEGIVETIAYRTIERNPDLPPGTFEFHPPEGAKLTQAPNFAPPAPSPIPTPVHESSLPSPIFRAEPEYTQEAWDEGIQGTVIVLAEVDPTGDTHDFKIQQSLGWGLDEKAIECVRKWRFRPATRNGSPVKSTAWIELAFTLPDKRPEQPSPFPVPGPPVRPRLPVVQIEMPTGADEFFYVAAVNLHEPEICYKVQPLAEGSGSGAIPRGFQIRTLRSECYEELARRLHDAALCEHVQPVRTDVDDGSLLDKAYCVEHLDAPPSIAVPWRMDGFVQMMRRLGYDDGQVLDHLFHRAPYDNSTMQAYLKLEKDPAFIERVRAGRSYAEPRNKSALRPARAVEFLYQMAAVDTAAPDLCKKISPNALFTDLWNQTALLQSECYVSIALNRHDPALCEKLPPSGTFPNIRERFDSREECRSTVAVQKDNGGGTYGPTLFRSRSDFPAALRELGYDKAYIDSLIPPPTADDYWTVFGDVSSPKSPNRGDLLRRIMELK